VLRRCGLEIRKTRTRKPEGAGKGFDSSQGLALQKLAMATLDATG